MTIIFVSLTHLYHWFDYILVTVELLINHGLKSINIYIDSITWHDFKILGKTLKLGATRVLY